MGTSAVGRNMLQWPTGVTSAVGEDSTLLNKIINVAMEGKISENTHFKTFLLMEACVVRKHRCNHLIQSKSSNVIYKIRQIRYGMLKPSRTVNVSCHIVCFFVCH